MDQPHLTISLLGEFSLLVDGKPVSSFNGDRPITLLAYLLLNRHTPQSRQQLAFTLWPDSTDSQARANLRNLFYTLRQTLPYADRFLVADALTLQWRLDTPYTLDVADFEEAVLLAKVAADTAEKINYLETAVTLYKGDLLLGNYDDWVIPLREELHQSYLEVLHQLLNLYEQQQAFRAAARIGQRLLQQDPLDETTYVQLMRLHALSGDRAGVRRLYEQCVATLSRELDIEPSPTTQSAYEQFLRLDAPMPMVERPLTVPTMPPPIKTHVRPLPNPPTPFIGREVELAHIAELLADPHCRLLTIVGPGGMGKTRLALQTAVGHQAVFADGVAFVSLAPLQDAQRLGGVIAEALGMLVNNTADIEQSLLTYLHDKTLLLVLDNFEHLLPGVEMLSRLLGYAPQIKLLITSRQRLQLQEEWVFEIAGLTLPDEKETADLAENSAISLFLQSARRANVHFDPTNQDYNAILEICELVGGMPLGIELAASWVRMLSCADIAAEMKQSFDFLQVSHHNIPLRHRNLRTVFEHSWHLLSPAQQQTLRRLTVFRGSFGRDAAEQVAGASLMDLSTLTDNSLVRRVAPDRYSLHELIRQYAHEKLVETQEVDLICEQHLRFLIELVKTAEHGVNNSPQIMGSERFQQERDNIWACMDWAAAAGDLEAGITLVVMLGRYWMMQGQNKAASSWLETQLQRRDMLPPSVVTQALTTIGFLNFYRADYGSARRWLEEAAALAQTVGDEQWYCEARLVLGMVLQELGEYPAAYDAFSETLAQYRQWPNEFGISRCLINLGTLSYDWGRESDAITFFEEALMLARRRNDADTTAIVLTNLGWATALQQDFAATITYCWEAFNLFVQIGNYFGLVFVLDAFAAALALENPTAAAELLGAAAHLRQQYELPLSGANAAYQQKFVESVRQQLDTHQFDLAWARGAQWAVEEVLTAVQQTILPVYERYIEQV